MSYDQTKTGMIPLTNFLKIMRILGVHVNQTQIKSNEIGMVDYKKVLDNLVTN